MIYSFSFLLARPKMGEKRGFRTELHRILYICDTKKRTQLYKMHLLYTHPIKETSKTWKDKKEKDTEVLNLWIEQQSLTDWKATDIKKLKIFNIHLDQWCLRKMRNKSFKNTVEKAIFTFEFFSICFIFHLFSIQNRYFSPTFQLSNTTLCLSDHWKLYNQVS